MLDYCLGLYWAYNAEQGPGPLFPGSGQKDQFGKVMQRLVKDNKREKEYGTHSIRKGVATFACSGSTGGPSIVCVCLRYGWSLGHVQHRYLRYEAASDQILGRVVAALPLNKATFATLPPHFQDTSNDVFVNAISQMHPNLKSVIQLLGVLNLYLASLAFHSQTLFQTLPKSHPIFHTYIFREQRIMT
jgi:hypothetical protein